MVGVRFQCQAGCINCCAEKGYVYLSGEDVTRAAAFVGMTPARFEARYVYRTKHLRRFRKPRGSQCPFLDANGCAIHPAKPTQCRAFPFWPELVESRGEWRRTARYCPGIGKGPLLSADTLLRPLNEMRESYPTMYAD